MDKDEVIKYVLKAISRRGCGLAEVVCDSRYNSGRFKFNSFVTKDNLTVWPPHSMRSDTVMSVEGYPL